MVDENPYASTMPDQQDAFSGSVEFKLSFTTSITFVLGWGDSELRLYLNDMNGFHKLVVQYSEPGNPLTQYLNDNLI